MSAHPTPAPLTLADVRRRVEGEAFDAETAPLCDGCEASFRAPGDTLCPACRAEVDTIYADLPGAEP